jgi:hypothetical protein
MLEKDLIEREEFEFIHQLFEKVKNKREGYFFVHENIYFFSKSSLWFLSNDNRFRISLVWIIEWW